MWTGFFGESVLDCLESVESFQILKKNLSDLA